MLRSLTDIDLAGRCHGSRLALAFSVRSLDDADLKASERAALLQCIASDIDLAGRCHGSRLALAFSVRSLDDADLKASERAALLQCIATPDREFREIAARNGVDRERLQDLWFDLFVRPQSRNAL